MLLWLLVHGFYLDGISEPVFCRPFLDPPLQRTFQLPESHSNFYNSWSFSQPRCNRHIDEQIYVRHEQKNILINTLLLTTNIRMRKVGARDGFRHRLRWGRGGGVCLEKVYLFVESSDFAVKKYIRHFNGHKQRNINTLFIVWFILWHHVT